MQRWLGWLVVLGLGAACQATAFQVDLDTLREQAFEQARKDLRHRDEDRRRQAADSLGGYRGRAEAVTLLAGALADRAPAVRQEAANALWRLAGNDTDIAAAAAALRVALDDASPAVRVQAAGALEQHGDDPATLVPARRSVLRAGDWFDVALAARDLLGHVPPVELAEPLLQALRATPASSDKDRFDAGDVLVPLAATGDRALLAPLMEALSDPALPKVQLLQALGSFDPPPPGWLDAVLATSRHPDADTRERAAEELERYAGRGDADPGWPARALHLLEDAEKDVRFAAAEAMAAAGGDAHPAVPALLRLAEEDASEVVQRAAIRALEAIGDPAEAYDRATKGAVASQAQPVLQVIAADQTREEDTRDAASAALEALARGGATGTTALAVSGATDAAALQRLRARGLELTEHAFWRALSERDAEAVADFLAAGISPDAVSDGGMPPLQVLVMTGCDFGQPTAEATRRMVASLLSHGADPDQRDDNGNTALHRATSCDAALVRQLLAAGADPLARNGTGHLSFTGYVAVNAGAAQALLDAGFRLPPADAKALTAWLASETDPAKRALLQRAGVR